MSIFNLFTLMGGLALFLYGMNLMGESLEQQAGGKLQVILSKLSDNPLKGFLLGLGVTAVIQSSSATTVMVVGFVNSGIMQLHQAVGIIMGSNVGTTVTSWLLSLTGIQGDSFWVKMLKPSSFGPILAFAGIILAMFCKSSKKKGVGNILLGFFILMTGMEFMSSSMKPLADMPWFSSLFLHFSNPILGVLAGAALTAIIQSSSASVGILQALALTGSVTYGSAIPIIMGQNIGTCVTAMISSVGASKNAKRAAFVHLYFNVIGVVLFLTAFYSLNALLHFEIIHDTVSVMGIAVIHSTFNVITTLVLLPFNRVLEKLAILTVPDGTSKDAAAPLLDKRLLGTPAVATSRAHQCTVDMAQLAQSGLLKAMSLVHIWNDQVSDEVVEQEAQVDHYEDALGTYLVQLSGLPLTVDDNRTVNTLLYSLSDLERISDHSLNLRKSALEVRDKQVTFSHQALEDLNLVEWAVQDIVNLTVQAFANQDNNAARQVEPLEQVIDEIVHQVRSRHVERLQNGQCSITNGFILADLLTCYERVADHCSNVAVAMIEVAHDSFDTHEYLQGVKADREGLDRMMDQYRKRYGLAQA
ncbi:MAG: Na/Pi cotransporter family protein [Oscillospiraceae bacterium]|nr:Na/Pi cotransporter family protein [Bacteroidales bacterium]MDD6998411.1 Na/Pi cotransporter family protein [Oscillospiraceae bacterium]MDY5095947.1 Na/Pi cotransporter family protein [Oscillospiraceae bacterium]